MTTVRACARPGCLRPYYARGYCRADYMRIMRNGTLAPQPSGKASPRYGQASTAFGPVRSAISRELLGEEK